MLCRKPAEKCIARLGGLGEADKDGWRSVRCPLHPKGRPLRVKSGDRVHVIYRCFDGADDAEVFAALVREGIPPGCLARPRRNLPRPRDLSPNLTDTLWVILTSERTEAERLALIAVELLGEVPRGDMVGVLADRLGLGSSVIYRATAELRRGGPPDRGATSGGSRG